MDSFLLSLNFSSAVKGGCIKGRVINRGMEAYNPGPKYGPT